jgi:hypothetical protein
MTLMPGRFPEDQQNVLREVALAYRRVMRAPPGPAVTRAEISRRDQKRQSEARAAATAGDQVVCLGRGQAAWSGPGRSSSGDRQIRARSESGAHAFLRRATHWRARSAPWPDGHFWGKAGIKAGFSVDLVKAPYRRARNVLSPSPHRNPRHRCGGVFAPDGRG